MIKAALAAVAAPLFAGAAMAGPYVNIEANSGFTGADYTGTTTDAHVATLALLAKASPGMLRWVLSLSPLTVLTVRLFSLVRLVHLLPPPSVSPSMVRSPSPLASMMLTTVTALRWVQPSRSDK